MTDRIFNRRSFIGGALALTGFAVLPVQAAARVPMIVGDGVHDDAPGIQALLDGKPAMIDGTVVQVAHGGTVRISGGTYRLSHKLTVGGGRSFEARNFRFLHEGLSTLMDASAATHITLDNGVIAPLKLKEGEMLVDAFTGAEVRLQWPLKSPLDASERQ